ncbi:MAG: cation:proton antiporter subunit C [Chromatiales bacterium]|jgi:multisubunit Na+/H+ antiporter MnhC subunit
MMPSAADILFFAAIGLLVIGLAGMILSHHLFRMILALVIAEAGANLLLVVAGFRSDAVAPILLSADSAPVMVDPVPQALVLTAIVIGVGVQALALSLAIRLRHAYGTLDMRVIKRKLERELADDLGVDLPASSEAPLQPRPLPEPVRQTSGSGG